MGLYVSEALARGYKLHMHDFFSSVGTFGGLAPPPPPQYQKAGYATGNITFKCVFIDNIN